MYRLTCIISNGNKGVYLFPLFFQLLNFVLSRNSYFFLLSFKLGEPADSALPSGMTSSRIPEGTARPENRGDWATLRLRGVN
jgi:hypothetical protein